MKEFQISKEKYYKMMLFDRFIIEINKLGNKTYNTKKINYLILLLNVFKWDMDLKKKIFSVPYIFLKKIIKGTLRFVRIMK